MNALVLGILLGIASFFALQMTLPFPYGLIAWFMILLLIIRYAKKYTVIHKDSVLNYRRTDPINEKEKQQNDEALRILEKKYIEEKITKEEYLKRKKEFVYLEHHPKKCNVCGSEDFELISGEQQSDVGYRCKRCGTNEK